jgi:hypothetical protein
VSTSIREWKAKLEGQQWEVGTIFLLHAATFRGNGEARLQTGDYVKFERDRGYVTAGPEKTSNGSIRLKVNDAVVWKLGLATREDAEHVENADDGEYQWWIVREQVRI